LRRAAHRLKEKNDPEARANEFIRLCTTSAEGAAIEKQLLE